MTRNRGMPHFDLSANMPRVKPPRQPESKPDAADARKWIDEGPDPDADGVAIHFSYPMVLATDGIEPWSPAYWDRNADCWLWWNVEDSDRVDFTAIWWLPMPPMPEE